MPREMLVAKAAPMANPSTKLCTLSPTSTITATLAIPEVEQILTTN